MRLIFSGVFALKRQSASVVRLKTTRLLKRPQAICLDCKSNAAGFRFRRKGFYGRSFGLGCDLAKASERTLSKSLAVHEVRLIDR